MTVGLYNGDDRVNGGRLHSEVWPYDGDCGTGDGGNVHKLCQHCIMVIVIWR